MTTPHNRQERTGDSNIDISVIVPAFNEENAIGGVLKDLKKTMKSTDRKFEIIVVDDGSTDNTVKTARNVSGITLIQHPFNRGYGAALKTGITKARGELIIITDADGTYPNEEIPKLLKYVNQYDMVVGARTGQQIKMAASRRLAKYR